MVMQEYDGDALSAVKSTCYMCYNACGIIAWKRGNTLVRIEGDPDNPQNDGRICAKGRAGPGMLSDPNRILTPLKRTNPAKGIGVDPQWAPISWDEALALVSARLAAIRADDPRKLIGCMFDAHVYTQFFTWLAAFGTPNGFAGGAGFYCGNGMHPVAALTSGTFFLEPDLSQCRYLLMVGTQNGHVVNHLPMKTAHDMAAAKARGMKLVVVDPIRTNAATHAYEWLPIKPGTDAALALAIANVLVHELSLYDAPFLRQHTNAPYLVGADGRYVRDRASAKPMVWDLVAGRARSFADAPAENLALLGEFAIDGVACAPAFSKLAEHLRAYTPEHAGAISDIPAPTIRRIAAEFGAAAQIGATIEVEGQQLPLRPACVNWYRGPCAHRHGFMTGFALQLLNMLVGAIDVPGGHLGSNPIGPWWRPRASEDGLLIPTDHPLAHQALDPYPGRLPKSPTTVTGIELFPVAPYASTLVYDVLLDPETYKLPYRPEMLIVCRSNPMMSTINPDTVAKALTRIPYIVAFAFTADETTELADIVFPDAHYLERLDAFSNAPYEFIAAGPGVWNFMIRQPVVEPPAGVRHWMEVMFELAQRTGFSDDLHAMLNQWLPLAEPFTLEPGRDYSWEDIADRWLKSHFGAEQGLAAFKETGVHLYRRKTVEEAYPRPFLTARIPIYLEHFLDIGRDLATATAQAGIPWDTADYQPLPDWKPCAAHTTDDSEYDLFAVNFKVPYHTFSLTVGNPFLAELTERDRFGRHVLIHPQTAARKRLIDGDQVVVESSAGLRLQGSVRLTGCVRPDVLGFAGLYGRWAQSVRASARGGPHFNKLLPYARDRIDTVAATMDMCIKVRVSKQPTPRTSRLGNFVTGLRQRWGSTARS